MAEKKNLVIMIGPTAVGKTDTSIKIAQKLHGEIISADSMQIYRYMNIGTAKVTVEEQKGIPHYLIDEIDPDEDFSVSKFQSKAKKYISDINERSKIPIVVGGTGLYVNSLIYNLDFTDSSPDHKLREKLVSDLAQYGKIHLFEKLKEVDPQAATKIHMNNTKRVIRALEVFYTTGERMSETKNHFRELNNEYNLVFIGLNMERERLYERINRRVDMMIAGGLIEEVKRLRDLGYDKSLTSMQGLGYKEILKYIEGEYTLEQAVYTLKRDTRRFAKRQLTWFRREKGIKWFYVEDYDSKQALSDSIISYIKDKLDMSHSK